jgi:hypothetical protein
MTSFIVPYLLIVLSHLSNNMLPMNEFILPETWTKDFTIKYSFSGSMDGSRTELTFSYDSCNYTIQPGMKAPQNWCICDDRSRPRRNIKKDVRIESG